MEFPGEAAPANEDSACASGRAAAGRVWCSPRFQAPAGDKGDYAIVFPFSSIIFFMKSTYFFKISEVTFKINFTSSPQIKH